MGGVFTEWASWPWVFLIYIPIGLATLAATGLLPSVAGRRGSVDLIGAVAVTAGLALAVFAVVRAPEVGWGSTQRCSNWSELQHCSALAYLPAMMAAMSGVSQEQAGLASGIVNTTYQVGSALGLAALTALATSQGAGKLGDLPALTNGFSSAFVAAAAIAAVGALLTLLLMRSRAPEADGVRSAGAQADATAGV